MEKDIDGHVQSHINPEGMNLCQGPMFFRELHCWCWVRLILPPCPHMVALPFVRGGSCDVCSISEPCLVAHTECATSSQRHMRRTERAVFAARRMDWGSSLVKRALGGLGKTVEAHGRGRFLKDSFEGPITSMLVFSSDNTKML